MNTKVTISERALFARINRKLKKNGEQLHRCRRGSRWFNEMGPYYIVDTKSNVVTHCGFYNLEERARNLNVLKNFEQLENFL